jgi:ParB-like chromosome segregation protein Spo0J
MTLAFHPLADIFPLMTGAEFDDLVADVKAHGLLEPIVIYRGQILDGRNRYRACEAAGVDYLTTTIIDIEFDPLSFVISRNLKRRHLNESQRAMIAARLATLRRGDNQHSEGLPIGRSSELLNVSERSIARAREVLDKGTPELAAAVDRGEVSVSAAAKSLAERNGCVPDGILKDILNAAEKLTANAEKPVDDGRDHAAGCGQGTPEPQPRPERNQSVGDAMWPALSRQAKANEAAQQKWEQERQRRSKELAADLRKIAAEIRAEKARGR